MKRSKKIFFSIIAIFVVIVGLIAVLQWDNIEAIYVAKTHTKEELKVMLDKNSEVRAVAVAGLPVRELTVEERDAIKSGALGNSEALKRILKTRESTTNSESAEYSDGHDASTVSGSDVNDASTVSQSGRDYDAELAGLVGQVYVLEASYSGSIENLVSRAIAEYKALPADQHTDTNKWNIGVKYLGTATSMEASCDSQMATILNQIESVLIASGGDMKLLGQIKSAYANEKILKKDYYLSLYS